LPDRLVQSKKLVIHTCYCHEVTISHIWFLHHHTKVKEVNSSVLSILFIPLVILTTSHFNLNRFSFIPTTWRLPIYHILVLLTSFCDTLLLKGVKSLILQPQIVKRTSSLKPQFVVSKEPQKKYIRMREFRQPMQFQSHANSNLVKIRGDTFTT
jgi:hypothetical protein